jgi:hypothetical protein
VIEVVVILVVAVCLLALAMGPRPRPDRDPYRDAERWSRIAIIAFTISAIGWTVALLAALGGLIFG